MSEYRTTATLTVEGTFVVSIPEALPPGTEAEIIVRVGGEPNASKETQEGFYRWLESQPFRASTREAEFETLRRLRDEWN